MPGFLAAGCSATATRSAVAVDVESAPSNGRCLFAGVDITAPADVVWQALTDYDCLDSFIPGVLSFLLERSCALLCYVFSVHIIFRR